MTTDDGTKVKRERGARQAASLVGIAAAGFLAVTANVLAARHVHRWDWTSDQRYSLSLPTLETLRGLGENDKVTIWVLLGAGDPLEQSVKQLLVSYEAEGRGLVVRSIDPDHDTAALLDLRNRFQIETGKNEDGHIVTDAVVIVERGDRHWFLTAQDLFEQKDESTVEPREERAITGAIRNVEGGVEARLCFTTGHGELATEPAKDGWIGELGSILEKDNYTLSTIDTTRSDALTPFDGCTVVIVAGVKTPFAKDEANRLRTYAMSGGNVLLALGPVIENSASTETGLDDVLQPFGVKLGVGIIHDPDPHVAVAETLTEGFVTPALPHPVTAGLVAEPGTHPPSVVTFFARPLEHAPASADGVRATDLLRSSAEAYAVRDLHDAANWTEPPPRAAGDAKGPFAVAMASERPKLALHADHGPRMVVFGSTFVLTENNWHQPRPMRGSAFLVENALSWLSARPLVLDIPPRKPHAASVRMTEESLSRVRTYVLVYMPLAMLLLATLVALFRRSGEGAPWKKPGGT